MKLKILVAIAALAPALQAFSAIPQAPATATIDWGTFKWVLKGSNAGVEFSNKLSSVNANFAQESASDWITPISQSDGVASAAIDSPTLATPSTPATQKMTTTFASVPPSLNSSAYLFRNTDFTLTANSAVVFTVKATTYIDMTVPLNGTAYAWAFLNVDGPGVLGTGDDGTEVQHSGTESRSTASGLGNPQSNSRTLQATFSNYTDSPMVGKLTAFGLVYKNGFIPAIPEPRTYAMMLAGLGLLGFVARRRKLVAVPA